MRITIPLRGSDYESAYSSYELFISDIAKFSNNSKLITLIDIKMISDKNEKPVIKNIKFNILEGNINENSEPEIIQMYTKKHSFFNSEWINEYLIIDLTIKDEASLGEYTNYFVDDILTRLSLLVNLTYSTNIDFLPGLIYSNENEYIGRTKIVVCSDMYAYEHSERIKWPLIRNIKLIETINWFHKYEVHPNQMSVNKAHKAINAFSQLIGDIKFNNTSDLFWVMLGIESLLAEGNQGITKQIKDKSILILGEPKEYKKKLQKLYDYRSRLVHGDIDIFPSYYSDFDSFDKEYNDYLDFAISILIALIRELIFKQADEFIFELKLK
ncbi:hypothetical protein ACE01N_17755 [Saccharicrinis sp. FJH2]|uniref:hypothetical protein n=1 Tax=Saccharicrinis sp. FJH65 TaxID=3344659 RepID=UPI0035F2E2DE